MQGYILCKMLCSGWEWEWGGGGGVGRVREKMKKEKENGGKLHKTGKRP